MIEILINDKLRLRSNKYQFILDVRKRNAPGNEWRPQYYYPGLRRLKGLAKHKEKLELPEEFLHRMFEFVETAEEKLFLFSDQIESMNYTYKEMYEYQETISLDEKSYICADQRCFMIKRLTGQQWMSGDFYGKLHLQLKAEVLLRYWLSDAEGFIGGIEKIGQLITRFSRVVDEIDNLRKNRNQKSPLNGA